MPRNGTGNGSGFANALGKGKAPETPAEAPGAAVADPPVAEPAQEPEGRQGGSRRRKKHIGAYFDPAVSRQLRQIALEEDSTVQDLVAEALDMLFQSRRRSPIAREPAGR